MLWLSRFLAATSVVAAIVALEIAGRALWLGRHWPHDNEGYNGPFPAVAPAMAAPERYVDQKTFDSLSARVAALEKELRALRREKTRPLAGVAEGAAVNRGPDSVAFVRLEDEVGTQGALSDAAMAAVHRDVDRIAGYNQTILVLTIPLMVASLGAGLSSLILSIRAGRAPDPAPRIVSPG